MAFMRLQVELPALSGVPEDVYTNTFYFSTDTDPVATAAFTATTIIKDGYDDLLAGGAPLASYMSNTLDRLNCLTKAYDMADPEPRIPTITEWEMDLSGTSSDNLPEEVALCMSYHGAIPITASRRGRVYIGPLNMSAVDTTTAETAHTRPKTAFIQAVNGFANHIYDRAVTEGWQWLIKTGSGPTYVPIVGGWCDNAWDTQRRRGVEATVRTTWTG